MRILTMGDSITDMGREKDTDLRTCSYGDGYPFFLEGELATKFPGQYEIYNRGISGNRIVDIYARIKKDCWNLQPDIISVLIGVNDVWHEVDGGNGVDIERYERFYRMYIDDTLKVLPNVKFMLLEPFVLCGTATEERWDGFGAVKEYAKVVKKIADEKGLIFIPLQNKFDELAAKNGVAQWLYDGVHPSIAGSKIIADAWLEAFYANILK